MQKIKLLKNYKNFQKGSIIEVDNNVAFGLIDSGIASLVTSKKQEYLHKAFTKPPKDKMMRSTGRRRYKTK